MAEWILDLMNRLGYLGIFLLMVLENLFPPIPSEVIMPAAGFAASPQGGQLNFAGVVLAGALGSVVGTLPLYYIGRFFGEDRAAAWAERYGKWLNVSGADIRRAGAWFDRYGASAVLFGRMVPGIRSLLSLPAGVSEMPLGTFLIFSLIGSALWAGLLAAAGYFLGENYSRVEQYVAPVSKIVVAALLVALAAWIVSRKRAA